MKRLLYIIPITILFLASCNIAKFSITEKTIIKQKYERSIMPLMLVSNKTDSITLYTKSKSFKISNKDRKLKKLVNLMYETCNDTANAGVGIAAPQVGINKRIVWVQRFDKKNNPFEVYFNIEITSFSPLKSEGWEGCLSVPNYRGLVNRSDSIIIKYDTFKKQNIIETIKGFTAVIFQHEIDHLEGILFTDRIFDKTKLYTDEEYERIFKTKNNSE